MMQDFFALVKTAKWLPAVPLALVIKLLPTLPQVVVETQRPYARPMGRISVSSNVTGPAAGVALAAPCNDRSIPARHCPVDRIRGTVYIFSS